MHARTRTMRFQMHLVTKGSGKMGRRVDGQDGGSGDNGFLRAQEIHLIASGGLVKNELMLPIANGDLPENGKEINGEDTENVIQTDLNGDGAVQTTENGRELKVRESNS